MSTFADDNILIERAKKGDREALDQLIRKYEKRAYQYSFRLTQNSDEASDVVGGHMLTMERPGEVNAALARWLAGFA